MKDTLQEGSQITLPEADSKPGTIFCKAIFVKTKTVPKVPFEDMRALSKTISNTKKDSVTSDPFSHAGEMVRTFLTGITADTINTKRIYQDEDFGEVQLAPKDKSTLRDWDLDAETVEEVHKKFPPSQFLKNNRYRAYLRNPFSEESKHAIREVFPGGPHTVNQHTLVREPFLRGRGKDGSLFNFTGEMANHYEVCPMIFHILLAAKTHCNLDEIADKDEVENKLQYLIEFHLGPNILDTAHLKVNGWSGPVFNLNAPSSLKITDEHKKIYGTTMMLTAIVNAVISHSLTSKDTGAGVKSYTSTYLRSRLYSTHQDREQSKF